MFFWRAGVLLDELRKNLPRTASILASLPAFHDAGFPARLREAFPLCENISIDYAVLEKAQGVAGIACPEIGWNDVGSWNAVYELLPHDTDGNVLPQEAIWLKPAQKHKQKSGPRRDAGGNYVDVGGKLVALVGVSNLIVIDTPDALLIASRDSAQQVGDVVKLLEKRRRDDLL
jgi:mannose-1-phosphate guanylyltransferase